MFFLIKYTVSFLCVLGLQKQLETSSYSKLSDAHTAIPPPSLHSQDQIFANVIQENCLSFQMSHEKKTALLSIESWLFNRDPYFMVYEVILISYNCVVLHPHQQKENGSFSSKNGYV